MSRFLPSKVQWFHWERTRKKSGRLVVLTLFKNFSLYLLFLDPSWFNSKDVRREVLFRQYYEDGHWREHGKVKLDWCLKKKTEGRVKGFYELAKRWNYDVRSEFSFFVEICIKIYVDKIFLWFFLILLHVVMPSDALISQLIYGFQNHKFEMLLSIMFFLFLVFSFLFFFLVWTEFYLFLFHSK